MKRGLKWQTCHLLIDSPRKGDEELAGPENLCILPPELLDFLGKVHGQTILVRGDSGTGKTVFALSLLERLLADHFEKEDLFYVTSRVPAAILRRQVDWIESVLLSGNILDMTQSSVGDEQSEESSLIITDELTFISTLDERLHSKKFPVCVIDSLDAVAERTNTDSVALVRALAALSTQARAKIILVAESDENRRIDYIVDSVISLAKSRSDDDLWRRITIEKLRGVHIGSGVSDFTLAEGRFTLLPLTNLDELRRIRTAKVNPHTGTRFFTGVKGFDEILGGFRLGSMCFLDVGPGVHNEVVNSAILTTIANFILQGGGVVIIPPNKLSHRRIKAAALKFNFIDELNSRLRLVVHRFSEQTQDSPDDSEPYLKLVQSTSSEDLDKAMDEAINELRSGGCEDILTIIGFGLLQSWIGFDRLSHWVTRISDQAVSDSGFSIAIGYSSTKTINEVIADLSDVHVTLTQRSGRTLMKGVFPLTPSYSVYTFKEDGGIRIGFREVA